MSGRYTPAFRPTTDCSLVYQRLPLARAALSRGQTILQSAMLINCCCACLDVALWRAVGRRT